MTNYTNTARKYFYHGIIFHVMTNIEVLSIDRMSVQFCYITAIIMEVRYIYFFIAVVFPEIRILLQYPSKVWVILLHTLLSFHIVFEVLNSFIINNTCNITCTIRCILTVRF